MTEWKLLKKENLQQFLSDLDEKAELFVPENVDDKWEFKQFHEDMAAEFPENLIDRSIKELFFPKRRVIARYDLSKKWGMQPTEKNTHPRIILGLRACDIAGIRYMDRVFLNNDFRDTLYEAERERTVIVGMVCDSMSDNCHCTDRGIEPDSTEGMDAVFTRIPQGFLFKAVTDKGELIMNSPFLEKTDQTPEKREWKQGKFPVATPEKVLASYEDDFWTELSDICLTCGACTFSCPTCLCFLVSDEKFKGKGERVTVWDTCQFSAYTRMAGGHNPRRKNVDRVRNRTIDKFGYSHRKFGMISCVGCGRCVIICPLKRSFPHIARQLTEEIEKKTADK